MPVSRPIAQIGLPPIRSTSIRSEQSTSRQGGGSPMIATRHGDEDEVVTPRRLGRPRSGTAGRRPWFLPEGRSLSPEVWQQRHRGLTYLLCAHIPALFVYGVVRGLRPTDAALQVAILVVPALIATISLLSR